MMMTAQTLSPGYPLHLLLQGVVNTGVLAVRVTGLATDSRKVKPGDLFIAQSVGADSGIPYIAAAVRAGAAAIVAEASQLPEPYLCPVPLVRVSDLHTKTGIIADRFYDHPSSALTVIGVTGTNGKTSVSHLLAQSLDINDKGRSGLIGTLGYGPVNRLQPGPNTTPEAVALQKLLAEFRDQNIRQIVMEVSSHGLDQFRVAGVKFDLAIFTNLTRDHLDYHGSMTDYAASKRRLFMDYGVRKMAINMDDPFGLEIIRALPSGVEVIGYTLGENAGGSGVGGCRQVTGRILPSASSLLNLMLDTPWGSARLHTNLSGSFNAHNCMAVVSALCQLGYTLEDAVSRVSRCSTIPGRMENFAIGDSICVVVDYAHTPDALEKVLIALRETCRGRLHCVFGCGGERDQGKRPLMGAVAEKYADRITLTNDNPRHEDPAQIINQILAGIKDQQQVTVEADRARAISNAISTSAKNDVILIAGKGHEEYQEIAGVRHPFSDQAVVRNIAENRT